MSNEAPRIKLFQEDVSITVWVVSISIGSFMFSFTNAEFKTAISPLIELVILTHAVQIGVAILLRIAVKRFTILVETKPSEESAIGRWRATCIGSFVAVILAFGMNYYLFLSTLWHM